MKEKGGEIALSCNSNRDGITAGAGVAAAELMLAGIHITPSPPTQTSNVYAHDAQHACY